MALTRAERNWWNGFLKQFEEKGYDINNPADRSCLYSVVSDGNKTYYNIMGDPTRDKRSTSCELEFWEMDDYYYGMQQVNEEYIKSLYDSALNNELYLLDQVQRNQVDLENKNRAKFMREIGVGRQGECVSTRNGYEINEEVNAIEREKLRGLDNLNPEERAQREADVRNEMKVLSNKLYHEEQAKVKKGRAQKLNDAEEKQVYARTTKEGREYLKLSSLFSSAAGIDSYEVGMNLVPSSTFDEEQLEAFTEYIGANKPNMSVDSCYVRYVQGVFDDAHQRGLESSHIKRSGAAPKAISKAEGRTIEQHLDDLVTLKEGTNKLEQIMGNRILFDEEMKPVDYSNPDKLKESLKSSGLYFYRDGERMPTAVKFDELTNTLQEKQFALSEPVPVKKPNALTKFWSGVVKFFTGKPLESVARSERYEREKMAYNNAQTNAPKKKTKTDYEMAEKEAKTKELKEVAKMPKTQEEAVAHEAGLEEKRFTDKLNGLEYDDPQYDLAKISADAWSRIGFEAKSGNPDFSWLSKPEDTTLASFALSALLEKEEITCEKTRDFTIQKLLDNNEVTDVINAINKSDEMKAIKAKPITPASIVSLSNSHGQKIANSINVKELKEKPISRSNSVDMSYDSLDVSF